MPSQIHVPSKAFHPPSLDYINQPPCPLPSGFFFLLYLAHFFYIRLPMKFSSIVTTAAFAMAASAKDVSCRVNGQEVAQVDLDTGDCPFSIPESLPVTFRFDAEDDYEVDAYYVNADQKYWNDIENAGRTVDVPAKELYGKDATNLFHVHAEESPSSNSTAALRRRFNAQMLQARDEKDDLVASIKAQDGEGTEVTIEVVDIDTPTPGPSGPSGTVTETNTGTTIITVTSCEDDKCHETTTPATWGPTTTTVEGTETIYTTWCPVVTETNTHTTIVTVTSCEDDKCHETTKPATWGPTTTTVHGEETVYTTWCPVETETNTHTTIVTVTHCEEDKCEETTKPATWGPTTTTVEGEKTVYTTWCPVETAPEQPGPEPAPTTKAPGATEPAPEQPAPTQEAPEKPAPSQEAPEKPAPTQEAPEQPAPSKEATEQPPTGGAPAPTEGAPSTVAGPSTFISSPGAPAPTQSGISTYEGAAAAVKGSLLALAAIPLAYIL